MLRAIVLAARLDFRIDSADPRSDRAAQGAEIATAAPARMLEEYYKVLRSGAVAAGVPPAGRSGPAAAHQPGDPVAAPARGRALAGGARRLSRPVRRRRRDTFTQPRAARVAHRAARPADAAAPARGRRPRRGRRAPARRSATLPLARRDLEVLDHALALQPRLADPDNLTPRAQREPDAPRRVPRRARRGWRSTAAAPDAVSALARQLGGRDAAPAPAHGGRGRAASHARAVPRRRRRRHRRAGARRAPRPVRQRSVTSASARRGRPAQADAAADRRWLARASARTRS